MNFRLNLFGKRILFDLDIRKQKSQMITGYTNRCKDGLYIIMIDYDRLEKSWIIPELKRLQKDFDLSDFYLFQSSEKSYHAVCFDKVTYQEYVIILKNSSVDEKYIYVPMNYGKKIWSLRLSKKDDILNETKITFEEYIMSQSKHIHDKSSAHLELIEMLFYKFNYYPNPNDNVLFDEQKELIFCQYPI